MPNTDSRGKRILEMDAENWRNYERMLPRLGNWVEKNNDKLGVQAKPPDFTAANNRSHRKCGRAPKKRISDPKQTIRLPRMVLISKKKGDPNFPSPMHARHSGKVL